MTFHTKNVQKKNFWANLAYFFESSHTLSLTSRGGSVCKNSITARRGRRRVSLMYSFQKRFEKFWNILYAFHQQA